MSRIECDASGKCGDAALGCEDIGGKKWCCDKPPDEPPKDEPPKDPPPKDPPPKDEPPKDPPPKDPPPKDPPPKDPPAQGKCSDGLPAIAPCDEDTNTCIDDPEKVCEPVGGKPFCCNKKPDEPPKDPPPKDEPPKDPPPKDEPPKDEPPKDPPPKDEPPKDPPPKDPPPQDPPPKDPPPKDPPPKDPPPQDPAGDDATCSDGFAAVAACDASGKCAEDPNLGCEDIKGKKWCCAKPDEPPKNDDDPKCSDGVPAIASEGSMKLAIRRATSTHPEKPF
ncbi:hypothetical protein AAVH_25995 [Aphelenchoides avenae]|nr:hypothetical protein AAVH_25995 [Aphelenchus avenae]